MFRRGDVAEIRVPKAGRDGTISGYFDNFDTLVRSAMSLDGKGTGTYVTLNPVDPALLARSANKIKTRADLTTSDLNILSRRWLLIDLDPNRAAGISRTDAEHEAALARSQTIADALTGQGWPEPVLTDSGNGGHILYRIDVPNDQAGADLISMCLRAITNQYSDKDVSVDQTVYNAARIIKLYGTVARKGDNTPQRSHRVSRILQIPESLKIVPQDLLGKLASEAIDLTRTTTEQNGTSKISGFPLESWMLSHNLKIRRGPLAWSGRGEKWELEDCPFNDGHTGGCAVITRAYNGSLGFRCQHNSCSGKEWHALRDLLDPGWQGQRRGNTPFQQQSMVADWPEPIPFQNRVVTPLPIELLPGFLGGMVAAIARATETPVELAALTGLAVVAASVAGKVEVSPEPGYIEPVNIYTACAMESGNRKSAVHALLTKPLVEWERSENGRMAPKRKRVFSERKTLEVRIEALRKLASKDSKRGDLVKDIAELEASLPEVPRERRLWVQDVTPEQLGVIMGEQGERIALLSDEGGIFDTLAGRYSKGIPNLDLFLQSHCGSPVRVDRGSRPPVLLHRPVLTVALSPQPDVLRSLADKPGFRGRGVLARFFYGLPPSPLGSRKLVPSPVPASVEEAYREGIARLLDLTSPRDRNGGVNPFVLRLSPEAYAPWKDFQRSVEVSMREGGRLGQLRDWASKLPAGAARIAGLLHCVVADVEADTEIQNDIMECSLTFAAVLIEHSLAVFDLMERDEVLENAQKILEWIRKSQNLKFTFGIASVLCNGVSKRWTKSTRLSENWKNMVTSAVLRTNQSHIVRAPCSK